MNWLDFVGAALSLLSTYYFVKADKLAWPVCIIANILNITLYYQTGIYGDMSLEGIYLLSASYGWYLWTRGSSQEGQLAISSISKRHFTVLFVMALATIPTFAYFLQYYAQSQVPYWDATTTILSLQAQWLMCKKIIETWYLWFIVDAMYVGLYLYKDIPFHSIVLFIYLALAVIGYWRWYKSLQKWPAHRPVQTPI